MGNCGSNPKTIESDEVPVPEPVAAEVVNVEQQETKAEETAVASDDKSLGTLLNENEEQKAEETKAEETKKEEVAAEAVVAVEAKAEEAKPAAAAEATTEEKPAVFVAAAEAAAN